MRPIGCHRFPWCRFRLARRRARWGRACNTPATRALEAPAPRRRAARPPAHAQARRQCSSNSHTRRPQAAYSARLRPRRAPRISAVARHTGASMTSEGGAKTKQRHDATDPCRRNERARTRLSARSASPSMIHRGSPILDRVWCSAPIEFLAALAVKERAPRALCDCSERSGAMGQQPVGHVNLNRVGEWVVAKSQNETQTHCPSIQSGWRGSFILAPVRRGERAGVRDISFLQNATATYAHALDRRASHSSRVREVFGMRHQSREPAIGHAHMEL